MRDNGEELLDSNLLRISMWVGSYSPLFELVATLWDETDAGDFLRDVDYRDDGLIVERWTFRTGGRVLNERIVSILQANRTAWLACWVQSNRAGEHIFEVIR